MDQLSHLHIFSLVLFMPSVLHSLIMWLTVSLLSPIYLLFLLFAHSAGVIVYSNCFSHQRSKTPTNMCPRYDIKPTNGEAQVVGLRKRWNTLLLPLLQHKLWPGVIVNVRFLSTDHLLCNTLKQSNCVQTINSYVWNHLTVCQQMESWLVWKCRIQTIYQQIVYIYIYI